MEKDLVNYIRDTFDVEFKNEHLLKTAFTHSSYANDHREEDLEHLERLEFLGDAVIELIVSDYLYKQYKELPEGQLTKMRAAAVRAETLAQLAIESGLPQFILLGRGEEQSNGRKRISLLCDVFEAFIGAIYLDQGVQKARSVLKQLLFPKITAGDFSHGMDYKTALQEWLQKDGIVRIQYEVVETLGPDHAREFKVEVRIEGDPMGTGIGTSKKRAEQNAAKVAYENLSEMKDR
jgi:ribonuclease-3